ncbi:DEAD/DEAH box helicase family protein [Salmonella enterica]|uniref:Restriction endonuclease subunit R n=2 Tax=Salmonella enterica TaxID=28901 RepID=A0A5T7YFE8_SALER|nr:DEAD/DEAH box helicase family protein [Salmonella enterica]EAA4708179.1 restriction endonuclease subunit R [Salmonella enterica subsp. diarizonae]EBP3997820.1 DEAD/DEAH box helicase [Salmonella enterica subsp. enterica]EBR3876082.1 DEAD/DEAH box helicase [Salmonella enterica subsp. arizonae]EDR1381461.1 DEAD/DEAH box helicase [Salmonella enterica subsp. diarizonae serovar 61:r:z53]EIG1166895.1 DEAD/DEAH box helicase family protein [Salmonella enterica subsp. diarizonae serovar 48:k:z53]
MKLHFEPNLDYQMQAIESVCDLFRGQEVCRTEFTVTMKAPSQSSDQFNVTQPEQLTLGMAESDLGVGNRLTLLDDELRQNLVDVQFREGLPPSETLTSGDFTVEMETGTGKTYVYLRTIFELNKRYGFSKFVIVVPSVAIKEGVYKTLQMTEEHIKGLYAGVPFDYFLYDSSKPGPVRNFATSSNVQIMVVTVGAINKKDVNNLYKENEKTGGEKPIDLIKATRPVVIVDEPQSVDGGLEGRGKEALDAMNPLCTLRYSATHVNKHHMVFRLDAVDAYERKLVKQIEVASATVEDAHNKAFVRLISIANKRGTISARIELDINTASGVRRQEHTVSDGDDLEQLTKRPIYADFRVGEINTAKGEEFMELRYPSGEIFLKLGQAYGDVDALAVQREMIRRTIREHLDKEKRLRPLGIKVLSLFFVDAVEKYRQYDADGNPVKGDYARIFEEEYRRAAKLPAYQSLFSEIDLNSTAEEVHNGYFSRDKKGRWTDTAENNAGNRENAERAYNLIMKEKEKLLSFDTPLKFIFSHSALKEGWDNPNVFQICTLRDIQSERERRQTIGRGLRLCVNQHGERVRGFEVNTLTVIATENYEQFAENLQKEIEAETGIRFGIVEKHQFALIAVVTPNGQTSPMGLEQSKVLWEYLKAAGHIDAKGKVQDSLKQALKEGSLALPAEFEVQRGQIAEVLRKVSGRLEIKNADDRQPVSLRKGSDGKAIYLSDEFKALWDRIKYKTTYRVQFDNAKLITDCINFLQKAPAIAKARLQWRKADIAIGKAGVQATEKAGASTVVLDETDLELPDILTELQDRTQLTRRTIISILTGSGRLDDFKRNPQQFIELAAEIINRCKRLALVDGIKYRMLGEQHVYAQELFEKEELTGYLQNMLMDTHKSIYEHVVYDSTTERDFADALEKNDAIKLYAKLPGWFKVPTPLGSYNPDWAVLVEEDNEQRLYFVVETKSSLFADDLRDKESAKILCGKAHFQALAMESAGLNGNPARYIVASSVGDLMVEASKDN